MNISRLLPIVCVNVFLAVPALAASQPATGSSAPISLCGESKADKGEKAETEATDKDENKAEKKTDKKDSKEKKSDSKASA
jgi:hypothetical protein